MQESLSMDKKVRLDPVFLLSPGRSGSTLLQRYLNASGELVLWGEHAGFLINMANSYRQFMKNKEVANWHRAGRKHAPLVLSSAVPVGVDIEWTNNFTRKDFHNAYVQLILELFTRDIPSSIRWGFKEIRYAGNEVSFLRELFPQAQFVYIVRNPIETIASMAAAWYEFAKDLRNIAWQRDQAMIKNVENFLEQTCMRMTPILNGFKEHFLTNNEGYLIKYEELREAPASVVHGVCSWLNVSVPSKEAIQLIASDKRRVTHSSGLKDALKIFDDNDYFQELLEIYKVFGYSNTTKHSEAVPGK